MILIKMNEKFDKIGIFDLLIWKQDLSDDINQHPDATGIVSAFWKFWKFAGFFFFDTIGCVFAFLCTASFAYRFQLILPKKVHIWYTIR